MAWIWFTVCFICVEELSSTGLLVIGSGRMRKCIGELVSYSAKGTFILGFGVDFSILEVDLSFLSLLLPIETGTEAESAFL